VPCVCIGIGVRVPRPTQNESCNCCWLRRLQEMRVYINYY